MKACMLSEGEGGDFTVLDVFYGNLKEGFDDLGWELVRTSLNKPTLIEDLERFVKDPEVKFFVGTNGFCGDIELNGKNMFELTGKPFINLQADPVYSTEMWNNVSKEPSDSRIDLLVDNSQLHWLSKIRGSTKNIYFAPPMALDYRTEFYERDIEVLLCHSMYPADNNKKILELKFGSDYSKICDLVDEVIMDDLRTDPILWPDIFKIAGFDVDIFNSEHRNVLSILFHYVRMKRRERLVEQLKDVPITLITSQYAENLNLNPDSKVLQEVPFLESLQYMKRAKRFICPPTGYFAYHERPVAAMCQGCTVISPPSVVMETNFAQGADFYSYEDFTDIPELLDKPLLNSMADPSMVFNATQKAIAIMNIYLSWSNR